MVVTNICPRSQLLWHLSHQGMPRDDIVNNLAHLCTTKVEREAKREGAQGNPVLGGLIDFDSVKIAKSPPYVTGEGGSKFLSVGLLRLVHSSLFGVCFLLGCPSLVVSLLTAS